MSASVTAPGLPFLVALGIAVISSALEVGGGIQYFSTRGDADATRYNTGEAVMGSATGSPNTQGWMLDLNYLPLQNIKLGARYTRYDKFNGESTNYDGAGRNAKDNNAVFLYGWFLF